MNDEDEFKNMKNKFGSLGNSSGIEQAMKSFESQQSLMDKALGITKSSAAIQQAMKSFESHQSIIDKALGITKRSSVIQQAMKSFESHQSLMDKVLGITKSSSAIQQAMKSFESQQSLMDKALGITKRSSAIQQAMKSFESHQSLMDKALGITKSSSAIQQAMKSFESQNYLTQKNMSAISNSASIFRSLEGLQQANVTKKINSDFLNNLASSISESSLSEYSELNEATMESDFQSATNDLSNTSDSNSFFLIFNKLPPFLQLILAMFFLQIFLPQLNSISANLLTPVVTNYLSQSVQTDREKVKNIKTLPRKIEGVDTTNLRFITGNNVRLRADSSINSSIMDEMVLGQVVTVHSKNKNWIEISYEYENGLSMHGWVFTRYTSRFVK